MTDTAGGSAAANDATVVAVDDIGALEDALAAARAAAEAEGPQRRIAAATRGVEKAKAHLEAAEDALKHTIAEEKVRAREDEAARVAKAAAREAHAAHGGDETPDPDGCAICARRAAATEGN